MTGYTKLFGTIIASTIWEEDDKTRIVWVTMMAMANKDGKVEASIPGLAKFSRVHIRHCEEALLKLTSPDKYSRTKDHEGRRIQEVDGGWILLNHGKYREKMNADERRGYLAEKQREHRAAKAIVNTVSTNVGDKSTESTQAEAKTNSLVVPAELRGPEFVSAWKNWIAYRRERRIKSYALRGAQAQLDRLAGWGALRAVAAIKHSIANGYQGIYEERNGNTKPHPKSSGNAGTSNQAQAGKY